MMQRLGNQPVGTCWRRGMHSLSLGVGLLLAAGSAFGAPNGPVQWQVKASPGKPIKPGAKFQAVLAGRIEPGWHVYALEEPQGGPLATEVALTEGDPADLLRVNESRPETIPDPLFSLTTGFFKTAVEFTLNLQLARDSAPGTHALHVLVRYQSCNDRVCLPPHTDTVEVPLTVAK